MLAVIDRGPCHERLDRKRLKHQVRFRQVLQLEDRNAKFSPSIAPSDGPKALAPSRLHPWCGLSTEVIDVFGQVLTLCRSSRIGQRKRNAPTIASTSDAFADIILAHDLQRELLAMDFDVMVAIDGLHAMSLETGDEKTPLSHLILTAEAYRHASLIQLYLSFEDLDLKRPIRDHASIQGVASKFNFSQSAPRAQKLMAMSLQLASILELIPADSGSRCIQPVLLILAATGLRLDSHLYCDPTAASQVNLLSVTSADQLSQPNLPAHHTNSATVSSKNCSLSVPSLTITQASLEISKARRFVRSRLRALQDNLPPRPVQVAVDLVNAIWAEYDGMKSRHIDTHWLDVMHDSGLKTMFG